jgi:hypothetical protein
VSCVNISMMEQFYSHRRSPRDGLLSGASEAS